MKILTISHGHPTLVPGGGEIAAYELFKGFQKAGHEAHFLARVGPPQSLVQSGTRFQTLNSTGNEYLYYTDQANHFLQSGLGSASWADLRNLLIGIKPDVVHFQHTIHLGVEWLHVCRSVLPGAAFIYTLHEYLLICNHSGQMIRTYDGEVCDGASPVKCNRCFPNVSPQEFKMRELFIKAHLKNVDAFVAPSRFLLQKYVEWGIPENRISFIQNGRIPQLEAASRPLEPSRVVTAVSGVKVRASSDPSAISRGNFGFFGQLNPYKGILVLLGAMALLAKERSAQQIHLYLHGGSLEMQTDEFRKQVVAALEVCKDNVTVLPPYRPAEIPKLMRNIDWVVVPSTWYENSPLVIQEAFMHKRPVICSDIGGNGREGCGWRHGTAFPHWL